MSLYLPEQKLGSHSGQDSSSNKFVLKGRQTGSMHRGHNWVFRAESHDTMMAWYDDIKTLTEQTPEERNNLVRANSRSISRSSQRSSVSSDGVDDEEEPPFTATVAAVNQQPRQDGLARRPSGGRFPSDLQVNAQRGLQVPLSPLSVSSGYGESLNHLDPFTTAAPTGSDFGQRPQDPNQAVLQRATPSEGPSGGPLQRPIPVVAAVVPGRSSTDIKSGDNSASVRRSTSVVDGEPDGPMWAEPVPIHLPISRQQHQQISSPQDSAGRDVYGSESTATMSGSRSSVGTGPGTGPRTPSNQESIGGSSGGAPRNEVPAWPPAVVRTDSIPTISHLHIPGEFPSGSAGP